MICYLCQLNQLILDWPVWEQFRLVRAHPSPSGSIFGLAEYLASLALFLVVIVTSDFRYSYRLSLTKTDLRKVGFWVGLSVGTAILVTDVWFENEFPIPKLISNPNNLKAIFGFVFLAFVFRVISVAVKVTVDFINDAITLVEKHAVRPNTLRISDPLHADIYDDLANLIFKTIDAASFVSSPDWTSWAIQHNAVWSSIFGLHDNATYKIIALKVRRLLYDKIKEMDKFANFQGAHILGYCLNVLGLKLTDRHKGFQKEFYPLQAAALSWTKANFRKLLADYPNVAKACLQGQISYDVVNHRLIKTYANAIEKEPVRVFLDLD